MFSNLGATHPSLMVLFFSNSINLFVDGLFVVSTPEITISFRLGGAAIVGWRGQSIKKRTTRGSVISNARFLKLYKKFLNVTSDVGSSGDRHRPRCRTSKHP